MPFFTQFIYRYILILTIGVLFAFNGYGQTTVTYDFSASGAQTGLNENSPGIALDSNIGFGSFKNGGTANPGIFSSQLRLYQDPTKGGSIIIYANNGVTITDVVVNASDRTGNAGYIVDNGSQTNLAGSNTYSINGISATSNVEFFQRQSNSSNRIYVDTFSVTYTTSGGGGSCSITDLGLANIACDDNGTGSDASDDFITFDLTPTGSTLGSDYTVSVNSGSVTPTTGSYGSATSFTLDTGTAGGGDVDVTITDDTDNTCTATETITDPGSCSSGGGTTGVFEDFDDGDFSNNPTWSGSTTDFSVITNATIPNGSASTDGLYLASNASENDASLAVASTEVSEWRFSLASPDFNPSSANNFGVVLMASSLFSGDLDTNNFTGYFLRIGINGSTDPIELWRKTGSGESKVGDFPSSPNFGSRALEDGLDIRITRSSSGEFELFYATGFQYNATPTTSAGTLTNNAYSTSSYFGVYQRFNNASSGRRVYIDNIDLGVGSSNSNDDDSKITAPATQVPASTIISDEVNSITVSEPVLRFDVEDLGSGDGVPTKISQISFVPGPSNTADWSDVIKGIRVNAGGTNIDGTKQTQVVLNDNEITYSFDFTAANVINNMSIDDGTTKEFEIRVFLNQNNITAGKVIQLQIEQNNTKFQTRSSGSALEITFDAVITGNQHTISIPSRALSFVQQLQTTVINENMNSDVQVAYVDNNGNVNNEETTDIVITSGGSMIGDPITETPVDGISTFTVNHDALASNIQLTASTSISTINNLDSNNFSIIEAVQLFITEIVDPDESGADGRYVEIYNAGVTSIDFSSDIYYIVRESNGGPTIDDIQLTGQIEAKGYYAIGDGNFMTKYGISSNLTDPVAFGGTIAGSGNDSYFISTDVADGNDGRNSVVDIYGVIGVDGNGETWEYTDSRAYRLNPEVKNANSSWVSTEWQITGPGAISVIDPTPKYGDQDYVYDGNWTNDGLGDPTPSTTISTENENIFIRSGNVTFDEDITIGDLVVRSGATLTVASDVVLTVKGDIVNEGEIIFKSDALNTAVLGESGSTTRVVGDGFQIERYVPATSRSFRYLCASVDTENSAKPTINDNWQEGATSASENPHPTYGTHITGSTTGANGLDQTSTGNPSLFQWDEGNQAWVAKTSTNNNNNNPDTDQLLAGDAYAMLIRGDRTATLNSNTAWGPETTLRATGIIKTGDVEVGVDVGELGQVLEDFSLVGNPYQAQVDLELLLKNNNTSLSGQFAYIYDPHITSNGGYATIDLGTGLADGSSSTTPTTGTAANRFLQPNQAFFVETTATSPTPSLTFTESVKSTQTSNVDTFSDDDLSDDQFISINLFDDDEQDLKDGVRVKFSSDYSNQVNNADAPKLWNDFEWFSVVNNNNYMAIESRAIPQQDEIVNLYTGNYQSTNYHFEINVHEMDYAEVQLYDAYQDSYTDLSSGVNSFTFSVDAAIPGSVAGDRFQLVFDEVTLSLDDQQVTSLQVYPNPVNNNRLHITGLPEFSSDNEVQLLLYDILGQEVYQESITTFQQDQEIKLPELSAGNYLLQLTSGQQTQNIHLLVK